MSDNKLSPVSDMTAEVASDRNGVTFRLTHQGRDRQKVMTLVTAEFIRRFQ